MLLIETRNGSTYIVNGHLTDREKHVLALTAQGKDAQAISDILGLSIETVRGYIKAACKKMNATSKGHAAVLALCCGFIPPPLSVGAAGAAALGVMSSV
ncbi:helix-turn-helix transcriptional regulator [Paludibacterium sp.]|uniref:helix-turn-helix transcriptional regulator n=1 Tax=Paludibacterium sp. TaxID=1917523 RepID=UPI0025F2A962|nr:helix-turn-helix transcriptional regulator [Paludibacterium sp.]MBV8649628.1 helix-turn-helix transcriptional regulator [Paludibacterium sp.]